MNARSIVQFAGAPLLAVTVWFALSWVPSQSGSADRRAREAESERAQVSADLKNAATLPTIVPQLDQRILATDRAVPPGAELAQFIADTGDAATRAGITIDQIAPLSIDTGDNPDSPLLLPAGTSSILVSIGATGGYQNLLDFVDDLTGFNRLVLVDVIDLNSDEAISQQVTMDLELRIFTTGALTPQPQADFSATGDLSVSTQ